MAKKKSSSKKSTPSFEEALDNLKQCLLALESDELTLDQSLQQYEDGIGHLKHCHRAIATAKQRIEKLIRIDAQGNAILENFDNTASEKTTSGTRRGAKTSSNDSPSKANRSPASSTAGSSSRKKPATGKASPGGTGDLGHDNGDMDDSDGLF